MPVEHSAVMSTRRSRGLSDIAPQFPAKGTGSVRLRRSSRSGQEEEETARFPRLDQCAHFHYDLVDLPPLQVSLCHDQMKPVGGDLSTVRWFAVQVRSHGVTWLLRRTYDNFRLLDQQIHRCVYDRKFSDLPELAEAEPDEVADTLERYLERFSSIAGNLVACGPVLNWLELDNRGRRLLVPDTDNCPINTPAVAAAYAVRRYSAQAGDEISFEVGDMISVIDMPPPAESVWWRGKRGFQVGFFPGQNVAVIGDKVPRSLVLPPAVSGPVPAPAAAPAASVAVANISLPSTSASTSEPSKPVLRKHGKLIAFFRSFILARPSRRRLKQSGILKERVFGCDLGEHLLNSGHQVPMVLKCCAEFIESNGIVDGIYRLSGVTSNIQKLRNAFDEDRVPALYEDEAILQDIHSVASLLKMYFRELPNPLCTYQLYHAFVSAVGARQERRLAEMRAAVSRLPPPHHRTLEYLMRHLARVAARGHATGMTARNVAIVWAPNLLRCKELEVGGVAALQGVGIQAVVTEFLVCYADLIFCDNVAALTLPPIASPKRCRPKSLAISTPTKLLTLEEARTRALGSKPDTDYIEVGGGPSQLPAKYHTVIELPRKRGAAAKRSPLGWKSLFGKSGRKNSMRKASAPSDLGLEQPAMTECDLTAVNRRRLRPIKSAESLSSANSSSRNSALVEGADAEEARQEVAQRNNGHSRSVSHDSYFDVLDTPEHARPTARPSRLLELDNEDSSLDLSEIQLNFDLEDSEMRIFSEDETLVSASYGSGSLGNSPRGKAGLRPRQPRTLPAEALSPRRPKNSCSSVSPTESSRSKRSRLEEQLASSAGELRFIDSQSPDNSVTTRAEVHPTSGQSSDSDAPVALYKSLVDRDSTCSTSASLSPGPCQQSFSNDLLSSIFSNTLLSETSNDCTNDCTPSDEFLSPRNQQTQENAYKTLTEMFSPEIEAADSPSIESKSSPELCLIEKVATADSSLRDSRFFDETRAIVEESLAVSRSPSNSQSLMPSEASGTQMSQSSSLDIPYNRFSAPSPDSSGNATPTLSESGTNTPDNQLMGRSAAACVSQISADLSTRPMETHFDGAQLDLETRGELESMPEFNVAMDERNESDAVGFVEERRPSHEYQNVSFSQDTPCKAYENVPMTLSFKESAYENVAPLVFTTFSPVTSPVKESLITIKYGNVTSPKRKDWDGGKVDALLDGVYQNLPREENVYENVEMKPNEGNPEVIYQQVKYLRRSVHEVNKLLDEELAPQVFTQEIGQQEVPTCHVPDLIQLESPVDNPNIHRELCNNELLATNQLSCSIDNSPPQEISLLDRDVCVSDLASLQMASLDQPHDNSHFGIMAATSQEDPQSFSELATTLSTSSEEHDDISEVTTMQLAPLEKPQEVIEVAITPLAPLDQPKVNELPENMASSYSPLEELCTREESSAKIAFASFDQRQASGEDFKFPEEQAETDLEPGTENNASTCLESCPLIDLLIPEDNHESLNSKSPTITMEYSASTAFDDRDNVPVSLERHRNVRDVSHRDKEESLEEFLSDTELTRRRFESEIGRDMIRERRMKLELEESGRKAAGIRALVNKFEASSPTKEVADIWPPKKHEPTESDPLHDKDVEPAASRSPTRRKLKGKNKPPGSGEESPTSPEPQRPGAWNDSEPVPPCIRARKNRARQQSQLSASLDGDTFPEAEGKAATRTQTSPDVSAPGSVLKPLNECHDEAQRRARIEKYKEERRTFLREKFRAPEVVPTPRVRADSLKGDRKLGKAVDDLGDVKTCRNEGIDKYSSLDRTVLKSTPSKESRFKNPEASQLECAILSSNKVASESLAKKAGGQVTCVKVTTRNAPDKYNVTMGWKGKETERSKNSTSPSKVVITSSVTSPTRRNPLEKDRRRLDSGATDADRRSPGTAGKKTGKQEAAEIRSPKSGDVKSWKRPSSIETPASPIVLDTGSRRKSSGSPSYCIRDMAAMFEGRDNSSAKSATSGKQCHLSSV